jgi:glutathione synthase
MNVLFVTDPLGGLDAGVDATVGLMTAAQALGADVWACCPEQLGVVDGRVRAQARRVTVRPARRNGDHRWLVEPVWWDETEARTLDVTAEIDLVQLRIDPPVDARYLHTTYLLDLVDAANVRVVNRPQGIRALHEKLGALAFPQLCPETVVSADPRTVREFVAGVGTAVIKPVDGFAGTDVWLVRDDAGATALIESATASGRRHVVAQRYLTDVARGNKRLFVLDGEIVGTVLRRPAEDDFRIGPPIEAVDADADDHRIVDTLRPVLSGHGIALAGIDVIAGRLIEINVTCPGGMHKTDALLGTDLSGAIMRRFLHHEALLTNGKVPA